jgi:hypothetical protein
LDLGILGEGRFLIRKLYRCLFICFFICLFAFSPPPSVFSKDNDFQLWNTVSVTHPFGKSKFSLYWVGENRLQNDASEFLLFYTAIGFFYSPWPWFRLGPFYRVQKQDGRPFQQVPYPEFDFFASLGPVDFFDRNLFQFFISSQDLTFQYRNLFQISHTFKKGKFRFIPFFYDEIFLGSGGSPISQNRTAAGNGFGFFQGKMILDLYYLLQAVKVSGVSGFEKRHVLGTALKFNY